MNKDYFKDYPDEDLISQAEELFDSIVVVECYSLSDFRRYWAVLDELERRGYEAEEVHELKVTKGGD